MSVEKESVKVLLEQVGKLLDSSHYRHGDIELKGLYAYKEAKDGRYALKITFEVAPPAKSDDEHEPLKPCRWCGHERTEEERRDDGLRLCKDHRACDARRTERQEGGKRLEDQLRRAIEQVERVRLRRMAGELTADEAAAELAEREAYLTRLAAQTPIRPPDGDEPAGVGNDFLNDVAAAGQRAEEPKLSPEKIAGRGVGR